MTIKRSDTYFPALVFLLIAACAAAYLYVGKAQQPNWDEEASIDIALGIRPAMVVGANGRPTGALQYEQVIGHPVFNHGDYAKHNTPGGVVKAVMLDNSNSVLYYLSLHYWIKATGVSVFTLRLFSLLTAVINLWLVAYILAKRLPQQQAWTLVAVALVAFNPIFLLQAFAIRSYMLCVCMLLLATVQWLRLIDHKGNKVGAWYGHALFGALALLSHYFAIAVVLPQYAWLAVLLWRRRRDGLPFTKSLPALLAPLIIVVPLLVWYGYARTVGIPNMQMLDRTWQVAVKGGGYEGTAGNYGRLLFNATAQMLGFDYQVSLLPKWGWQVLAGGIMALWTLLLWGLRRQSGINKGAHYRVFNPLLYAWVAGMLVYSVRSFVSGHFMLFHRTYLVFLLPFLLTGIVWAMALRAQWAAARTWTWLAVGLLLLVNVTGFGMHTAEWGRGAGRMNGTININNAHNVLTNSWTDMPILARQIGGEARIDSIVYTNWKTAHRLNYFLGNWPGPQRVDTSLTGRTIILYRGEQPYRLVLTGQ